MGRFMLVSHLLAITGDTVCRATNVTYRLDPRSARVFLAPYVARA